MVVTSTVRVVLTAAQWILRNPDQTGLAAGSIICNCTALKYCLITSISYQRWIVRWEGLFKRYHSYQFSVQSLPALCTIKIFNYKSNTMKKTLLSILILITVLLTAVLVYGNRSKNKPVREYIECKPAPVVTSQHPASTASSSITFSLLVL